MYQRYMSLFPPFFIPDKRAIPYVGYSPNATRAVMSEGRYPKKAAEHWGRGYRLREHKAVI
jgi:hypothetical protein